MLLHAAKYLREREWESERERGRERQLKQYAIGEKSVLAAEKFLIKAYAIGGKALVRCSSTTASTTN